MANFRLWIDKTYKDGQRMDFFKSFTEGKKVLHVGFVDWPKTRPEKNLHLALYPYCKILDGVDTNTQGAELLKVPNGVIYHDWSLVPNDYDVILVPEVIEHVGNVQNFLETLDKFNGTTIITAPDAYLMRDKMEETEGSKKGHSWNWVEHNHTDHNCWYTPWTLYNTIQKYSKKKNCKLFWLQNHSIAAVCN
jgi:hypothetical protein